MAVFRVCLQVEWCLAGVVVHTPGSHRLAAQLLAVEQWSVPGKKRGSLQTQVCDYVSIGIGLVLALTRHLLFPCPQEVDHSGVIVELCIDRQCPYQHGHRMGQLLVGTSVVYGVEQHLLLVVVFRQQIAVSCREEGTLVDAVLLTVGFDIIDAHTHGPRQQTLLRPVSFQIGQ